jgi:hypothetical protein
MVDTVVKVIALAGFIAFVAFLPIYVPDPDLMAVVVIVVGMATHDFFIRPFMRRRNSGRS